MRCAVSRALGVCVLMRYVLEVCSQQGIRGVCVLMGYVLGQEGVCSHEVCTSQWNIGGMYIIMSLHTAL